MNGAASSEREPFRPALVIGLITAGLLSFAAFILLLGWGEAQGERERRQLSGTAPAVSATGFAGIIKLAGKFAPVAMAEGEDDFDSDDLLVVALTPRDDPARVAQLLQRKRGQPLLLILPKWTVVRDPVRGGWVRSLGPWESGTARWLMGEGFEVRQLPPERDARSVMGAGLLGGIEFPLPRSAQVIEGSAVKVLLPAPGGGALVAQLDEEPHYVVADPDLLNNHGIRRPDTARAAVGMLRRMMPEDFAILFDTGNALEAPPRRNLLRSMFEPPFLAMTLALMVAALLAGLYGAGRFGPAKRPVRAIPFGKAALVENSAGLVRLAGREVRLGGAYAQLVRDEAARAGAAPPHLKGEALEAYLDRFTKPGETPFRPLAAAVREAGDRASLMAAAGALYAWKKDMIR